MRDTRSRDSVIPERQGTLRGCLEGGSVLRPIVQARRVEVGAGGPNQGLNLWIEADLSEHGWIVKGSTIGCAGGHESQAATPPIALDGWRCTRQAGPMPRTMRVEYPGAIYHVMDRGDRREDIVPDAHQVDRRPPA